MLKQIHAEHYEDSPLFFYFHILLRPALKYGDDELLCDGLQGDGNAPQLLFKGALLLPVCNQSMRVFAFFVDAQT